MFPLPSPPDTLVVRQLECVSCKEKFTIAEDYPRANGQPSQFWRLVPDNPADTQLRYESNRTRRTVTPQARSAPNAPADVILNRERSQRSHLNCPRCGADNRNWLNILLLETEATAHQANHQADTWQKRVAVYWQKEVRTVEKLLILVVVLISLLLAVVLFMAVTPDLVTWLLLGGVIMVVLLGITRTRGHQLWRQRFPVAHTGILLALVLAGMTVMLAQFFNVPDGKTGLMAFFVIFSAASILISLTSPWIKLRENQHLRRVAPTAPNLERTLWIQGFLSLAIFTIILPLLFFRLLPIGVNAIAEQLKLSAEPDLAITVDTETGSAELIIDGTNPAYLERRREAIDVAVEQVGADTKLMALWTLCVGLSSVTAVLLGMNALKTFVEQIDRQIPPPIFHSIANMTRVTVWEAKQALEVSGDMSHVQWTRVTRNDDGGIHLVGVHVTETAVDQPPQKYMPAQEYAITADAWARIIKARIKRTRVLVTATPASEIGKAFFQQVPQSAAVGRGADYRP